MALRRACWLCKKWCEVEFTADTVQRCAALHIQHGQFRHLAIPLSLVLIDSPSTLRTRFQPSYRACGGVPTSCPVYVQCLPDSKTRGLLSSLSRCAVSSTTGRWHDVTKVRTGHCIAVFRFYRHAHTHQNRMQQTTDLRSRAMRHCRSKKQENTAICVAYRVLGVRYIRQLSGWLLCSSCNDSRRIYSSDFRPNRSLLCTENITAAIMHYTAHSWVVQLGQATTPKSRPGQVMATHGNDSNASIGWY